MHVQRLDAARHGYAHPPLRGAQEIVRQAGRLAAQEEDGREAQFNFRRRVPGATIGGDQLKPRRRGSSS